MFFLAKYEHAVTNAAETEYYNAAASEAIQNGEALVLSSGVLTKCTTGKPQFIAMKGISAAESDRRIPCFRVDENQLFRVKVTADPSGLKPGDKISINSDGLTVGATKSESGVATVVEVGDAKSGDEIYVRIV